MGYVASQEIAQRRPLIILQPTNICTARSCRIIRKIRDSVEMTFGCMLSRIHPHLSVRLLPATKIATFYGGMRPNSLESQAESLVRRRTSLKLDFVKATEPGFFRCEGLHGCVHVMGGSCPGA